MSISEQVCGKCKFSLADPVAHAIGVARFIEDLDLHEKEAVAVLYGFAMDHYNKPTTPSSDTQSAGMERGQTFVCLDCGRMATDPDAFESCATESILSIREMRERLNARPSQPPTVDVVRYLSAEESKQRADEWLRERERAWAAYVADGGTSDRRLTFEAGWAARDGWEPSWESAKSSTVDVEALAEEIVREVKPWLRDGATTNAVRVAEYVLRKHISPSPTVRDHGCCAHGDEGPCCEPDCAPTVRDEGRESS